MSFAEGVRECAMQYSGSQVEDGQKQIYKNNMVLKTE